MCINCGATGHGVVAHCQKHRDKHNFTKEEGLMRESWQATLETDKGKEFSGKLEAIQDLTFAGLDSLQVVDARYLVGPGLPKYTLPPTPVQLHLPLPDCLE